MMILMGKHHRKKLETLVEHNDGFVIAEENLALRGPNDMLAVTTPYSTQ